MPPASRRAHRLSPTRRAVCAALVAAFAALAGGTAQAGSTDPGACFNRFRAAWKARAPEDITRCMEAKGKLLMQLFGYPFSGRARAMGPEQANETLKAYFKRISQMEIKDVTPPKSPKNVRLYEYAYKAIRENARTTRLQVKLKQDRTRLWVLASVTESTAP